MFSLDQNVTEINPDNSKSCSCNFTRTTSLYFSSFSRCIIGKLLSQVWVAKRNVGKKLEDIPAPLSDVKNILKKIEFKDETTRSRCKGWLVLPSRKYLQADILFPGCAFDCRLHIRGRIGKIFCYEYVSGSITLQWNLDFNEVPRDWGNSFVKSRVRDIEHLHLTNSRENYQNVRYMEVDLVI